MLHQTIIGICVVGIYLVLKVVMKQLVHHQNRNI